MRLLLIALALSTPLLAAQPAFADDVSGVWSKKCKGCHGADGKADTEMGHKQSIEDMTTSAWQKKWTDAKISDAITNGIMKDGKATKMKAFKDKLTGDEIAALGKFIRGLAK